MSVFLKNIMLFLFGKSLNGIIFAERETREDTYYQCVACGCVHTLPIFQNIFMDRVLFSYNAVAFFCSSVNKFV